MLVPLDRVAGTGYNVGLTATQFAAQPDWSAGGGYTSPSGLPIGGMRIGYDEAYHRTAVDAQSRYSVGPPALAAGSSMGYLPKDRSVPYLTEREFGMRGHVALGDDPSTTVAGSAPSVLSAIPWWMWAFAAYKVLL